MSFKTAWSICNYCEKTETCSYYKTTTRHQIITECEDFKKKKV